MTRQSFEGLRRLVGQGQAAVTGVHVGAAAPQMHGRPALAKNPNTAWAQSRLVLHGLHPGRFDGAHDAGTSAAIAKFQTRMGIAPTGAMDTATHQALAKAPALAGLNARSYAGSRPRKHAGHKSQQGATKTMDGQTYRGGTKGEKSFRGTEERNYIALASTGTVATTADVTLKLTPQKIFRGENIVCDPLGTAQYFDLKSITVGVNPQISGSTDNGSIPLSLFAPNQNGALDFGMDVADPGTTVVVVLNNRDTAAHAVGFAIFGHVCEAV